ncbi:hypothetical protein Ancab_013524 [Ancistrocladus abbreviatus]
MAKAMYPCIIWIPNIRKLNIPELKGCPFLLNSLWVQDSRSSFTSHFNGQIQVKPLPCALRFSFEGLFVELEALRSRWKIDYEATGNSLLAGSGWKYGAAHFVLLSAICVQHPLLEFQRAKLLKFEEELTREAVRRMMDSLL